MLLKHREAELFAILKRHGSSAQAKSAIADMFHQARSATSDAQFGKAALHDAALAQCMPRNHNLPMRAARSYHKISQLQDAAERYARTHQTTQAIATLRLYREVAPDEHKAPNVFLNCAGIRAVFLTIYMNFCRRKNRQRINYALKIFSQLSMMLHSMQHLMP